MKRKKWSKLKEQTLLTKYSDLLNSGTLAKLKTREKNSNPSLITLIQFTTSKTQSISPSNGPGECINQGPKHEAPVFGCEAKKIQIGERSGCIGERRKEERNGITQGEYTKMVWVRREFDNRMRLEREFDGERRRRLKMEEKRKEEELEWRERIVNIQIEHEKQMGVVGAGGGCDGGRGEGVGGGGGGEDEGWYFGFEFEFKEEEEEEGEVEKMTILSLNEVMCYAHGFIPSLVTPHLDGMENMVLAGKFDD